MLVLVLSIYANYPEDFLKHPEIKSEVNYIEYKQAYSYVYNNCLNKSVIEISPSPEVNNFYMNIHYGILDPKKMLLKSNKAYIEDSKTKSVYSDNLIYDNTIVFNNTNYSQMCFISRTPSEGNMIRSQEQDWLRSFDKKVFYNIDVYFKN